MCRLSRLQETSFQCGKNARGLGLKCIDLKLSALPVLFFFLFRFQVSPYNVVYNVHCVDVPVCDCTWIIINKSQKDKGLHSRASLLNVQIGRLLYCAFVGVSSSMLSILMYMYIKKLFICKWVFYMLTVYVHVLEIILGAWWRVGL